MNKRSREYQIFAKPVGALCNLRCRYCYYLEKNELYPGRRSFLMNDEMLERYILQNIEASTEELINFSWHGGEPLMAGIGFFRKAVALQKKIIPSGRTIINGIQTNGTLIDEEWGRFLAEENFIVGISIDGPGDLHNRFRRTVDNKPALHKTLEGYEILRKNGIISEILCVVNSDNVKHPYVVYDFLKQLGTKYLTFLPLVERLDDTGSGVSPESVVAGDFGDFLMSVFDEWVEHDIGEIKIQIIEEAARSAFNQEHTLCIFRVNCGGVPVLEHNGDFYSCDHYVDSEHLVGNISSGTLAGFLDSDQQQAFGRIKSQTLPQYCLECEVRSMCNGECPKNRFIYTPDGEPGLNYLCAGYKKFFKHCRPFAEAVAAIWESPGQ
jgi:uncharacterized protein